MDSQTKKLEHAAVEAVRPRDTVEIKLSWGGNALRVAHVPLSGRYVLGESSDADFIVGRDVLGVERLVLLNEGNVSIPDGSPGGATFRTQSLQEHVEFERGLLRIAVRRVRAGAAPAHIAVEGRPYAYVGGALACAGLLLVGASLVPPSNAALSIDNVNLESRLVSTLLEAETTPAFEQPPVVVEAAGVDTSDASFDPGLAGRSDAPRTRDRQGVRGPRDNERVRLPREHADPEPVGTLGVLQALSGAWNAPTSPFSRDSALGSDAMHTLASLTGDRVGDSFGFGSLGLGSTGRGAGGDRGGVVPVGGGGIGSGTCGCGEMGLIGHAMGQAGMTLASRVPEPNLELPTRESHVPTIRCGCSGLEHVGALSRDVIRRVVRRHHNEVEYCYERGLEQRADLRGRVTTRFVISPTGSVSVARVESSTLGHAETEQCIRRAVARWSFPAVDGGGVTAVTYPFVLETL